MTYHYLYDIFAYPFLIWGIIFMINDNQYGFIFMVIAIILLLIKDILICLDIRRLKENRRVENENT